MSGSVARKRFLAAFAAAVVVVSGGLALSGIAGQDRGGSEGGEVPGSWFGGYIDLALVPALRLGESTTDGKVRTVLAFVVADPTDTCAPSWGGVHDLESASRQLDLDRQVEAFRQDGNDVAVAFGGQLGDELSFACADGNALVQAYTDVLDRYGVDVVDFDVEGHGLSVGSASTRRAVAVARLQADREASDPLEVWLTLPVSIDGLTKQGAASIATMIDAGVELAGVNIMTMNFGPLDPGQSMLDASIKAADETHRQLSAIYGAAGQSLGPADVWKKIGLTPMLGANDVDGQVFDLDAAKGLNSFALDRGIARISMWSLNRDSACESSGVKQNPAPVSSTCSGVDQEKGSFARLLGAGYTTGR